MKQLLQQARTGEVDVVDVPIPKADSGCVIVQNVASLVSSGTERASHEFANKSLLGKARARPDLVREVVGKVRRDGLFSTVTAVQNRLDQPVAVGYSGAGTIVAVGEGISDLHVGDRVACGGAGYATHAEYACVPRLLVAPLPASSPVTFEEAAFATVGAVALHGIRTANVQIGDVVCVIGLGLLGQLTVQLLKAAGCRVIGMDIKAERADLARRAGADVVATSSDSARDLSLHYSGGHGVDAVLITAETSSSEPVNLAADIARDRAVVVAVGTIGMDIERSRYYAKELNFRISRSYGPGRYDSTYEQKGRDYPIGYIRWTENRNMEAFLQFLADGKVKPSPLITHRFPIEQARTAYDLISGKLQERHLAVLITYPEKSTGGQRVELIRSGKYKPARAEESVRIGVIGAGTFATGTLLPSLKGVVPVELAGICSANGTHARHAAETFGFKYCTSDDVKILTDPDLNAVLIATRHHLHAPQVLTAIKAGKHIFCEKPLCLYEAELSEIISAYTERTPDAPILTVGFNRRFAPLAVRMKAFLKESCGPLSIHYRINAGSLPADHWVNDPEQGGGRLLGEACHFIDFLTFLVGELPIEVQTKCVGSVLGENVEVSIQYEDGSQGSVSYVTNGDRSFSKERVEAFKGGSVAILDDFRHLQLVRQGKKKNYRSLFTQDKGHRTELQAFANAVCTGYSPIPWTEIVAVTLATLRAEESRRSGTPVSVDTLNFIDSCRQSCAMAG